MSGLFLSIHNKIQQVWATLAGGNGSSLIGFIQSGIGAVLRSLSDLFKERVSVLDFGADPTGATDSSPQFAAALLSIKTNKKVLRIPNGTYKGSFLLTGADYANVTIEGESKAGVLLNASDNATSVLTAIVNAHYPCFRNLTIRPGAVGNNGTHHGIHTDAVSGVVLDNVDVAGFNNNIHIIENNNTRMSRITASGAVFAAGITGCNIFASGTGAGGPGFWLRDSSLATGKFGIYLDAIEAPVISDTECLLQTDTGLYATNSTAGAFSTGPFLTNFFADSSSQAAIYLQQQINGCATNTWISGSVGASKGLVLSNSHKNSFNIQAFNNKGYAVHLSGNSRFNSFNGGTVSNNNSDGIVIDVGCFGNSFNGTVIHANTGRGYNWNDVTNSEPNSLIGCYVAGNGLANVKQGKDIDIGGNYLSGQTSSFQFKRLAVNATQATTMGDISEQIVMQRAGAIVGFSTWLTSPITAGNLGVRPMVNGAVKDTLIVAMGSVTNSQYGSTALSDKSVRFTAGDRIAAYFDADAGYLPNGSNLNATCWVIFD